MIKVRLEQAVLHDAVFLELTLGMGLGDFSGDLASILEDFSVGRGDEAFYYPDGMIICVPVAGDALYTDAPSVILEVLSPSTRRND